MTIKAVIGNAKIYFSSFTFLLEAVVVGHASTHFKTKLV